MRRWVVTNILDSERAYLATLDILLQVLLHWYSNNVDIGKVPIYGRPA